MPVGIRNQQLCLQSAVQVEEQGKGKWLTAKQATVLEKEKNEQDYWDQTISRLCQKSFIQSQQSHILHNQRILYLVSLHNFGLFSVLRR